MTSKDKLLDMAAHLTQIARQIDAMAQSPSKGGIELGDVFISASHEMTIIAMSLSIAANKLIKTASFVTV